MRSIRRTGVYVALALAALGGAPSALADVVTHTQHVHLGFTTSQPFTFHTSDSSCLGRVATT